MLPGCEVAWLRSYGAKEEQELVVTGRYRHERILQGLKEGQEMKEGQELKSFSLIITKKDGLMII